jgi:putative ABC transport system permease protein
MSPSNNYGMAYIKIKPGTEMESLKYITKTFGELFPLSPFAYNFKQEQNEQSYQVEAKWKQIILFSALLIIFISCIGLFGLSVLSSEKRAKEIGVRRVLGASLGNIISILSTGFLKLITLSLIISVPLAWIAVNKWLQNYPYRISPGWWLFASSALLVLLIAFVTVSFQSVKAALANPVTSLRSE